MMGSPCPDGRVQASAWKRLESELAADTQETPLKTPADFVVLIPVYDDWESVALLLPQLDEALSRRPDSFSILLVDDCSSQPMNGRLRSVGLNHIGPVHVLRLRRNLGHQRAIAVGLAHIFETMPCRGVVVMDGDGEDTPGTVPELLEAFDAASGQESVFAKRTRRSEGVVFRVAYKAYRILHLILTGIRVEVGNFSVIPFAHLTRLVVSSELWNHYAAACFKLKLPRTLVPIPRGTRLHGTSQMNFVNLTLHGLSAISVFGDIVALRILLAAGVACSILILLIALVFLVWMATAVAIPGWALFTAGFLTILLVQVITASSGIVLHVLNRRDSASFLPVRDYAFFVERVRTLEPADGHP